MSASNTLPLALAAAAAVAAGVAPAGAQCRLCAHPTTELSSSADDGGIQLQIETSIDFDRLILAGQGDGTAVIRPDGSKLADGSVTGVSPRAMVGTATVHGSPGRAVRIELPARVELYSSSGGKVSFDQLASDLPALPRLDSQGNLSFRFGGRVSISGDSEGEYRGDLPITVEYQ